MTSMPTPRARSEQPGEHRLSVGEVTLAYFEWAGPGRTVLMVHATGFHARVWDAVARLLPDYRVIAVDMRGHGRSDKPRTIETWEAFATDLSAFVRALALEGVIGVGHSMGGHSVTIAAARVPQVFAGLLLVDPVMPLRNEAPRASRAGAAEFVRRRRDAWSGPEEMIDRFRGRSPYAMWRPEVLEDYARWGMLPAPSGDGYVLACPPDLEADTYAASDKGPRMVDEVIPRVRVPVRVLRARQPAPGEEAAPFSTSPTPPELASLFADAEDHLLPEASHFIPMETPELVAEEVRALERRIEGQQAVEAMR